MTLQSVKKVKRAGNKNGLKTSLVYKSDEKTVELFIPIVNFFCVFSVAVHRYSIYRERGE